MRDTNPCSEQTPMLATSVSILWLCKVEEFRYAYTHADTHLRPEARSECCQECSVRAPIRHRLGQIKWLYARDSSPIHFCRAPPPSIPWTTRVISSLVIVTRGCVGCRGWDFITEQHILNVPSIRSRNIKGNAWVHSSLCLCTVPNSCRSVYGYTPPRNIKGKVAPILN
jgi:hypothetical protein